MFDELESSTSMTRCGSMNSGLNPKSKSRMKNCGLMKMRMISPRSVAVPVVVVGREQLKKPCKRKSKIIEEVNRNEEEQ